MGIGLTMARSIANRLGGSLDIDDEYTDGARFVFIIRGDKMG
jgi:signal transduction histidine kinase